MKQAVYNTYTAILHEELLPALGCTEPIAIALASAKARRLLGAQPQHIRAHCSGNIIKNAKSVIVPQTGNMRGIGTAAILGAIAGDPERGLEVLASVQPGDVKKTRELLDAGACQIFLLNSSAALHIRIEMDGAGHSAVCEIKDKHTNIVYLEKDGRPLSCDSNNSSSQQPQQTQADRTALQLEAIWSYCHEVDLNDIREVLQRQITCNTNISKEGLIKKYGVGVGKTLMANSPDNIEVRACAAAAAGSDARMGGCVLPVVINSGSGNQGMTTSLPVIEYAKHWGKSSDELLRALAFANLVTLLQKKEIGRLSAFCGAVSAACGAACGIAYLHGDSLDVVRRTIINTLGTVGGIVCDGAKASCAAKIAAALQSALLGYRIALQGDSFPDGDGIVQAPAEKTVLRVGRLAREGMLQTDKVILSMMVEPAEK